MPFEYCHDPEGWGPFNPVRVDLTPCALHTYVLLLPAVIATMWFYHRLYRILRPDREHHSINHWIYLPSQCAILLAVYALAQIVSELKSLPQESRLASPSFYVALCATIFAWSIGCGLNSLEHVYSTRPSDPLFVFYLISLISGGALASTLSMLSAEEDEPLEGAAPILSHLQTYLLALALGFLLEAWPRGNGQAQRQARQEGRDTVRDQVNLFSRATYGFLAPIMRIGYVRPLTPEDVPDMASREKLARPISHMIQDAWERALKRHHHHHHHAKDSQPPPEMVWVVLGTARWRAVPMVLYRLVALTLGLAVPVLLKHFLRFLEHSSDSDRQDRPPMRLGILLAVGMFLASALSSIFFAAALHAAVEFGQMVRGGLIDMIYRKSLVLSPEARQAHTVGSIVNRMSVDCNKWSVCMALIPWAALIPYQLVLGIYLLYSTIGWSIGAGILVVLVLMPIQGRLGARLNKSEGVKLTKMDERVRMMSELLASIKVIKLYGWEDSFHHKVNDVRKDELHSLKNLTFTRALMDIIFTSTTLLMALFTFTVYATIGGPGWTAGKMTVDVVFVSITLFGMISEPMDMISHCMASIISLKVSSQRIQDFLLSDEIDETVVQRYPRQTGPQPMSIELKDATMAWTIKQATGTTQDLDQPEADETLPLLANRPQATSATRAQPTLSNINLTFYEGTLTAVAGRVGQGKSSLLSAIIGEMYKLEGSISIYGTVAYVPQQAWIVHGTIRDNILFGKSFVRERYDRLLHACGLLPDLAILPAGDLTEIGERGINLSGGQKQRIALARAAYQDADIYLLDDPLSAVDAHVDRHLWENLVGPQGLLKNKTRVLVTHGLHHLDQVDQIVILKDGAVSEVGEYSELLSHRKTFYKLIQEHRVERRTRQRANVSIEQLDDDIVSSASTSLFGDSEDTEGASIDNVEAEKDAKDVGSSGTLTVDEAVSEGVAGWWIYKRYAEAASYRSVIMLIVLFMTAQAFHIATNIWLKYWIGNEEDSTSPQFSTAYYLGVYALLVAIYMVANGVSNYATPVIGALRAAAMVHDGLINRVLRLPMSFFDTTPYEPSAMIQGRVLNRFSSDLAPIDSQLGENFVGFFSFTFNILGTLLVIAISTPAFLIAVPPAVLTYVWIQRYYIQASGYLKKLYQVTQSPLYSHFAETLAGVSSIRVMDGARERFIALNEAKADDMLQANLAFALTNRWLGVRLECLGALMVLVASLLATWRAETVDASMVGLALSYAVNVTSLINYLVRTVSEIQNTMTNLERIYEYSELPTEAPTETGVVLADPSWPRDGRIVFRNYSTRYRMGLDLVLRGVSFEVLPGEKVGIVGRTGAGKSSLTLALFRIIEAANSYWAIASDPQTASSRLLKDRPNKGYHHIPHSLNGSENDDDNDDGVVAGGSIIVDGVDISTLGLTQLRRHLSIIPQEPTLFAGSLRDNLDPFHEHMDADLWAALERAHLKAHLAAMPGGLAAVVAQGGENFSVGQRSLICLARALLRQTKILVLDEATSSVDMQTDELIQRTIRTEFQDRTILTIAHRIKTVMDYDKILVLDQGRVAEFEPPSTLLQNKNSLFYQLALQAGEVAK